MKNVSEKTFEKIKDEKINPLPKWQFLVKNNGIWLLAIISALAGSVATAVMVHIALNRDWFIYHSLHHPTFDHFMTDLPFVWLLLFFLTIWIAHYNVEHSKSGYRYSHYYIVLGSLVFSLVFGLIFNFVGLGARVDQTIARIFPVYKSVENQSGVLWAEVHQGYLGGEIVELNNQNLKLKDSTGKIWQVDISRADLEMPCPLVIGQSIKVIGEETAAGEFRAFEVRLWSSPGPRRIFIQQESIFPLPFRF